MIPYILIKGIMCLYAYICYLCVYTRGEIVSFPDPTMHARKGFGDIGADSWFCKLSNHVIICMGLYWSMCSHVMVHRTKKTLQCPQILSLLRVDLGTRLEERRD